jgi:HEAT repeat protein
MGILPDFDLARDVVQEAFLGITPAAVQGRLQRGRAALKKELMAMVEETFQEAELPEDFSAEVKRLLDELARGAKPGEETLRGLAEIGGPAVDPLCEALGDPRAPVRQAAARALCRIGDPRALNPILRVLYSEDWRTAVAVLRTGKVLQIAGMREELLRIARTGRPGDQHWAIGALANAKGDDAVFSSLCELFRDRKADTVTRGQALHALCKIRPDASAEWVAEALHAPELARRRGFIYWIARLHGILPTLEDCLLAFEEGADPNARGAAGHLLLEHGEAGKQALEHLLRSGSRSQRLWAAMCLADLHHPEAFDVLKSELLRGPGEPKLTRWLTRKVGWCFGRELAGWIESEKPDLRAAGTVLWALARDTSPHTSSALERLSREGTPSVRAAAVRILARERKADALPELRRTLREGRPGKVAQEAFMEMRRLRDAALPAALEMLASEHWTERKAALCLLRQWGKLTAEQRARGLTDPHPAVRHAADWHPAGRAAAAAGHPKWKRRIGTTAP